jgi:hypothetical protein
MSESRHFGANLTNDPDDTPELLGRFFEDAEIRQGETIIRPAASLEARRLPVAARGATPMPGNATVSARSG